MLKHTGSALTLALGILLSACGSGSAGSSGSGAGPSAGGSSVKVSDVEARLQKAGWTVESSETLSDLDWPAVFIQAKKGNEDNMVSARLWVDSLGDSSTPGAPRPELIRGEGAFIRLGWEPGASKKPGPDLAAYAKQIAPILKPEEATDKHLFSEPKYDAAVKTWNLREESSRSGGRAAPSGAVFNHRFLSNDDGTLNIEIIHFKESLAKGDVQLNGTTLVAVECEDAAARKSLYQALSGG